MIILSEDSSNQIKVLNVLCILMVVGLHSYSRQGYVIGSTSYLAQEFLIGGIFNTAVPMFFVISGILFFKDMECPFGLYIKKLKARFKTIVIPYLGYSLLALSSTILLQSFTRLTPSFNKDTSDDFSFSIHNFLTAWLIDPQLGRAGHLWFLRDLILLFLISPLIFWVVNRFRVVPVLLFLLLWLFEIQIFPVIGRTYLIGIESLFFFVLGAYLAISNFNLDGFMFKLKRLGYLIFFTWILNISIRVLLDPDLDIWYKREYDSVATLLLYKLGILLGILSISLISRLLFQNQFLIWFSGFSFALYLFHYPLAVYVKRGVMLLNLDPLSTFFCRYILTVGLTTILVFVLRYTIPEPYGFLTGNRGLKNV